MKLCTYNSRSKWQFSFQNAYSTMKLCLCVRNRDCLYGICLCSRNFAFAREILPMLPKFLPYLRNFRLCLRNFRFCLRNFRLSSRNFRIFLWNVAFSLAILSKSLLSTYPAPPPTTSSFNPLQSPHLHSDVISRKNTSQNAHLNYLTFATAIPSPLPTIVTNNPNFHPLVFPTTI